jgi:hypothetical protein
MDVDEKVKIACGLLEKLGGEIDADNIGQFVSEFDDVCCCVTQMDFYDAQEAMRNEQRRRRELIEQLVRKFPDREAVTDEQAKALTKDELTLLLELVRSTDEVPF